MRLSIDVRNLIDLERVMHDLKPPRWPADVFGPINATAASEGKKLFVDKGCASCHAILDRTDLTTPIKANMARIWSKKAGVESLGTDPMMACNAAQATAYAGVMKGMKLQPITTYSVADAGTRLGEKALLADISTVSFIQVTVYQKFEAAAKIFLKTRWVP